VFDEDGKMIPKKIPFNKFSDYKEDFMLSIYKKNIEDYLIYMNIPAVVLPCYNTEQFIRPPRKLKTSFKINNATNERHS